MFKLIEDNEYKNWLIKVKTKIKSRQIKAALKVNSELVLLYWDIGDMITQKQMTTKWGSGAIVKWEKVVPKIPWGHHILILKKIKNTNEALFYITETTKNNWNRNLKFN